jgi:hypothetical protein
MRGQDLARAQWLFVCAVHNVMKAVRHITSLKGKETALAIICNSRRPTFSGAYTLFFLVFAHHRVLKPTSCY